MKNRSWKYATSATAVTLALALAACGNTAPTSGASASPQGKSEATLADCKGEKILTTQTAVTFVYLPAIIAKDAGYFDKLGLKVDIAELGASTESLSAVAAGSADVAVLALSQVMKARQAGAPVQAFAMVTSPVAVQVVMKRERAERLGITEKSTPEERAKALVGAKIGISSPGSSADRLPRAMMMEAGLNPDRDAEFVPLGGGCEAVAGFVKGHVDVLSYSAPVTDRAMQQGDGVPLVNIAKGDFPELAEFDSVVAAANESELKASPGKFLCYLAGSQVAMGDISEDYKAAGALAYPSFEGLDKATFDLALESTAPAFVDSVVIPDTAVAQAAAFTKRFGDEISPKTMDEVVNTQLAERARELLDEES